MPREGFGWTPRDSRLRRRDPGSDDEAEGARPHEHDRRPWRRRRQNHDWQRLAASGIARAASGTAHAAVSLDLAGAGDTEGPSHLLEDLDCGLEIRCEQAGRAVEPESRI